MGRERPLDVEYVRYAIPADERERFEQACGEASRALEASPHCMAYELACGVEQPEHYVLRIQWDSLEGHAEGFRRQPRVRPLLPGGRPLRRADRRMAHYEQTAVMTGAGAA